MYEIILEKFIDPVDSSLRVHRDKLEQQINELNVEADQIINIFQYLQDNYFLSYSNIKLVMTHECGIYLIYYADILFKNKYINTNQYHQLLYSLFSDPTLIIPRLSIAVELISRNQCNAGIINLVLTTPHLEALQFCEEKLESVSDDQYSCLLSHILVQFQNTSDINDDLLNSFKTLLHFLSLYGLLSVENIDDAYHFLPNLGEAFRNLTTLQYPKDVYDLLITHPMNADIITYIAKYISEDMLLTQDDEALQNLFRNKKDILEFYRKLDNVQIQNETRLIIKKTIIEAANDDIPSAIDRGNAAMAIKEYEASAQRKIPGEVMRLVFTNPVPITIASMVIAINKAFPNAQLDSNFIPLTTFIAYGRFIHHSNCISELLTAYKTSHMDTYPVFHKAISANPNNVIYIADLVKNLQNNFADKMKPCIFLLLISMLDNDYPYTAEAGLFNHHMIDHLTLNPSDVSYYLLGFIYSGAVKEFESIKDFARANEYYKKIPDGSIWHIKASEKLLATNKNTAPIAHLLNANQAKKQVRFEIVNNTGASAALVK